MILPRVLSLSSNIIFPLFNRSEAGKPSSAAKPLSHPPNPRNNPPSHRNVQPLPSVTRKPQSVANHNTPNNTPLVSKPSNGPTTANTSSSNIPSSSSKPVKNGLPICRFYSSSFIYSKTT